MDYFQRSEVRARMAHMPGWNSHWSTWRLAIAATSVSANANELCECISRAGRRLTPLVIDRNVRSRLLAPQLEVYRLLMNHLASAKALVEFSRKHVRAHHKDDQWKAAYDRALAHSFHHESQAAMYGSLRNYILHNRLPRLSTNVSPLGGFTIRMACDDLLEWDKWKAIERAYIKECGVAIDVGEMVAAYTSQSMVMTAACIDLTTGANADELEKLYLVNEQMLSAMKDSDLTPENIFEQYFTRTSGAAILEELTLGRWEPALGSGALPDVNGPGAT